MKVLVGCESSGVVRDAFAALGHDSWSCDLLPCERGGKHIEADVREAVRREPWDLFVVHPPCTFLCSSGMHWTVRGLRPEQATIDAIAFAEACWSAPVHRIALENPAGALSTRSLLGRFAQRIQPYQFGHDASKGTCLWLKNLPPLSPTLFVAPRIVDGKRRWANQTDSGQNKLAPSKDRWKERSRTYEGIAAAMAEQWCAPDAWERSLLRELAA